MSSNSKPCTLRRIIRRRWDETKEKVTSNRLPASVARITAEGSPRCGGWARDDLRIWRKYGAFLWFGDKTRKLGIVCFLTSRPRFNCLFKLQRLNVIQLKAMHTSKDHPKTLRWNQGKSHKQSIASICCKNHCWRLQTPKSQNRFLVLVTTWPIYGSRERSERSPKQRYRNASMLRANGDASSNNLPGFLYLLILAAQAQRPRDCISRKDLCAWIAS